MTTTDRRCSVTIAAIGPEHRHPLGRRLQAQGEFLIGTNRRRLQRVRVRFRPRLVNAQGRSARFADGGGLDVGVVVWATGYLPDYS